MQETKIKINEPVYLGLSLLEISKTLMYEFWYHYIKPKYQCNTKLCYIDTESFIIHIKLKIFINILQMILKKDLIHEVMTLIDHYQKVK